jgi:CRISPR/Cas system CSM-associated protein Csm2 small subunit
MEETNIQWHLGVKPAVDLELAEERASLSYFRDFSLNQQALEIDLLIIRRESDQPIRNEIGRLFKKYNIIEYKSPKDELNIDTLYKVGAYTSLYKAYGDTVDERRADEITTTLIRKAKPVKLFHYFEEHGISLENPFKGIYYVKSGVLFPTQIIVTKELNPQEHIWLTALSDGMQKQQLKDLLVKVESFHTKLDRELADAVLGVAIKANWQVAQELRGDGNMCEALMELMEPEINKIKENVREETMQQGIKNAIIALRVCGNGDIEIKNAIMKVYGVSDSEAESYL